MAFTLTRRAAGDLKSIAHNPNIGTQCDDIKPGYRKFPKSDHIIFYRFSGTGGIEIVRILHKRMDVRSKLFAH